MYDSQTIALDVVESTCVVNSYTVVDAPQTPVHNTPCPLHWVCNKGNFLLIVRCKNSFERPRLLSPRVILGCSLLYWYGIKQNNWTRLEVDSNDVLTVVIARPLLSVCLILMLLCTVSTVLIQFSAWWQKANRSCTVPGSVHLHTEHGSQC